MPNISITEEDVEEFEDNPESYIKNDLEDADIESRRKHCMRFLQRLSKRFGSEVA